MFQIGSQIIWTSKSVGNDAITFQDICENERRSFGNNYFGGLLRCSEYEQYPICLPLFWINSQQNRC